jgi:uncharacterized protein YbaR (Trm112 family)
MLEQEFVAILRCVETGSELRLLDESALAKLNTAITNGEVATRVGQKLERPLEAALVNAEGSWVYQVLDGIPVLLSEQAIPYQEHIEG